MGDIVAVDIGSKFIKVMVGNNRKIAKHSMIETPANSVSDGRITDIDAVYEVLNKFMVENSVKRKLISFAIHGQDVILRHIEAPIMKEEALRNFAQYEIGQYLPMNGETHFIDYKIIDKISEKDKKVYKLLVIAAPRDKINSYVELSNRLNMKLKFMDISSNCASRVFKDYYKKEKVKKSIGIIDIGSSSSSIIILDGGKLFIEREVAFGVNNIVREISRRLDMDEDKAYDYFTTNFNFEKIDTDNELQLRIKTLFDNVFSSFDKVIEFYNTGKTDKALNKIFLIGSGSELLGMDTYMQEHFGTEVKNVKLIEDSGLKVNTKNLENFNFYINCLGLILRNDKSSELNIIPYEVRSNFINFNKKELYIMYALVGTLILVLGYTLPNMYLNKQKEELNGLNTQINTNKSTIDKNAKLRAQVLMETTYNNNTEKLKKNKILMGKIIEASGKYLPNDIIIKSYTVSKGQITMNATTTNYQSINVLWANLQMSKDFTGANINGIKYDEKTKEYSFTITFNSVGGDTNASAK